MSVYKDGKKSTLFKDDYRPAELYRDGEKICGFEEQQKVGKSILFEGSYNDELDVTCHGEHIQKTLKGYNQIPTQFDLSNGWTREITARVNYSINEGELTLSNELTSNADTFFCFVTNVHLKPNTRYTLSWDMATNGDVFGMFCRAKHYDLCLSNGSKYITFGVSGQTICVPTDGEYHRASVSITTAEYSDYTLRWASDGANLYNTQGNAFAKFKCLQLEEGDVAHDYEPYCGGIPSPNPDFPQEIVSVKPCISVGTNLWNKELPNNSVLSPDGWIVKAADTYDNIFSRAATTAMGIKPDTDYTVFIETTGQTFVDYPDKLIFINDERFFVDYVIGGAGQRLVSFSKTLRIGKYSFKLHTKSEWGSSIGFLWFNSARRLPEFKYRLSIIEGHFELSDFIPRADLEQSIITDYELYGDGGIYDTLEPRVMVNGEWKCRVTRRWGTFNFNRLTGSFGEQPNAFVGWISLQNTTHNQRVRCDKFSYTPLAMNTMLPYYINDCNGAGTTKCLSFPKGTTQAQANEMLTSNPIKVIDVLENPVIELYPPIDIKTYPYITTINGNTEMLCKAKVKTK